MISIPTSMCFIIPNEQNKHSHQTSLPDKINEPPFWYIELALTAEQHYLGLSYRPSLPQGRGMLFIFSKPTILSFCMRHCFISLDIAFISSDMRIVGLTTMPVERFGLETRIYRSMVPALYALEVNAGELNNNGVGEGDTVRFSDDVPLVSDFRPPVLPL
jgi:uncharacterized membrane protein (UPF0127 family)